MKSLIILILTALLVNLNVYSQNSTCECLVYKTSDGYKNHISIKGEKIDWGIRFTWQGTEEVLNLITTDSILKYKAGQAFAYVDTDCSLYRFYKEDLFIKVLYQGNIFLYSRSHSAYYKGMKMHIIDYYFSQDFFAPVYKLTKKNLIKVYKENASFVKAIKQVKNNDTLIKKSADKEEYNLVLLYNKSFAK